MASSRKVLTLIYKAKDSLRYGRNHEARDYAKRAIKLIGDSDPGLLKQVNGLFTTSEKGVTEFAPEGLPDIYRQFADTAGQYDGYVCSRKSKLLYDGLAGVPLDFTTARDMSPDGMDEWLDEHCLEDGWTEMYPGKVPLAFFEEEDEEKSGTQDEIRELLCVDAASPECPVELFVREGGFHGTGLGLERFLTTLERPT